MAGPHEYSSRIRALQAVGLTGASFAAGAIFSFSHVSCPAIAVAPASVAVRGWSIVFSRGLLTGPPASVLATLCFGTIAYAVPSMRRIYALAAVLPAMIFPYTSLLIVPINNKLAEREAAAKKLGVGEDLTEAGLPAGESTKGLIEAWRFWNYFRSTMPLAGALVGAWATFGDW